MGKAEGPHQNAGGLRQRRRGWADAGGRERWPTSIDVRTGMIAL